jgi:hypothetical protein
MDPADVVIKRPDLAADGQDQATGSADVRLIQRSMHHRRAGTSKVTIHLPLLPQQMLA